MPRFAANLSMMFCEVPFLDRFAQAANAGFKGVEFQSPYDWPKDEVAKRLRDNNLQLVLFNMPAGNWDNGDRGLASIPGREAEFMKGVEASLNYAKTMDCRQLHMLAGIRPEGLSHQLTHDTYSQNLKLAAQACQAENITILIEPINQTDMPGYFLNRQDQAIEIIDNVAQPNIGLQMDLYHCQISEGNLARHLRDNIDHIAHIQIAGVPERHEPDNGEINYPYLYELIDKLGYSGWIGCEYHPATETNAGLGWAAPYLAD
jgi:hydroxypyruvate isomerase